MTPYLRADAIRAKVQHKLSRLAEESGDEELTTLGVLDAICVKIARLSYQRGSDDPTDIAVRTDFEEELLDWVAAQQGLIGELDAKDVPQAVIDGALLAQYNMFVDFQGRSCQVCSGTGCPRCDGRGYFDEPEPEQMTLSLKTRGDASE